MPSITTSRAQSMPTGEMARQTGANIETIRYYERIKILPAPPRTEGGRRVYEPKHVRTLAFIRRARELGFSIEDIRALLVLSEPGHTSCKEVRRIASLHLESVRAKLADLSKLENILSETVAQCSGKAVPACPVLDALSTSCAA